MGPPNFVRAKKVVPVPKRKEMNLPDTVITTQGSLLDMAVV